ncbi:hypothetical protein PF008_g22513, partial [Phytophthora fragariae]
MLSKAILGLLSSQLDTCNSSSPLLDAGWILPQDQHIPAPITSGAMILGMNITDATCDFGLAQTSVGSSAIMYYRAVKHDGSPVQQYTFMLCSYASLTVIVRGADPTSYGHIIPRPIGAFLTDSCTASLYSVYILALGYWALVIQQGAALMELPTHLKSLETAAITFVLAFYIAYNMSLFAFKGFQPAVLNYVQAIC